MVDRLKWLGLALLTAVTAILGFRAQALKAQRDKARERTKTAEASARTDARIAENLNEVREKHRREDEKDLEGSGDSRDDFNDTW